MGGALRDLRDFYTAAEVRRAKEELHNDSTFQKELKYRNIPNVDALMKTEYPLKYIGIELGGKEGHQHRFSLATVLRISLRPRSMDGASKGLRLSNHRKAFIERFPDIDAALSDQTLFDLGKKTDLSSAEVFRASEYAAAATPALKILQKAIGVPVAVALQVLRKGLAAYKRGHRPGANTHGWARARLTSFVMKGCTHYFPDHTLVAKCPPKTHQFWKPLPCLCHKEAQCDRPGKRTRANARHTGEK